MDRGRAEAQALHRFGDDRQLLAAVRARPERRSRAASIVLGGAVTASMLLGLQLAIILS